MISRKCTCATAFTSIFTFAFYSPAHLAASFIRISQDDQSFLGLFFSPLGEAASGPVQDYNLQTLASLPSLLKHLRHLVIPCNECFPPSVNVFYPHY